MNKTLLSSNRQVNATNCIMILSFLMIFVSDFAHAGKYIGQLDSIITATKFDNKVYIQTKDFFYKEPGSCSTDKKYAFSFDGNTPLGKNMLTLITSALTTGSVVFLQGDDSCKTSASGAVETLTLLQLKAKPITSK